MTTEKKKKATRRRIKKKNAVTREPANKAASAIKKTKRIPVMVAAPLYHIIPQTSSNQNPAGENIPPYWGIPQRAEACFPEQANGCQMTGTGSAPAVHLPYQPKRKQQGRLDFMKS